MAVPGGAGPGGYGDYTPRPQIRFEVIGEAFNLFQQQAGTWVIASLITVACIAVLGFLLGLIPIIGHLIAAFIVYIFMGGLYRMAFKQLRGEPIAPGDVFSATDVIAQLIIAGILVGLAVMIGSILCIIPGLIVSGLLMFTVPLIVDRNMGGTEAMSESLNTLKPEWLMATIFNLVIGIIVMVGMMLCLVGALVTMPVAILSVALLYRDYFRRDTIPAPGTGTPYPTGRVGTPPYSAAPPVTTPQPPMSPEMPPTAPVPPEPTPGEDVPPTEDETKREPPATP